MFSDSKSDSFPSFLDHPSKSNPLSLDNENSSESPNKNYCEDISLNQTNGIVYADMDTEKQYEQFSKALQKVAASLPSNIFTIIPRKSNRNLQKAEDHWELMKKKIKKPKKLKVTRSSRVCRICCLGFRPSKNHFFESGFY